MHQSEGVPRRASESSRSGPDEELVRRLDALSHEDAQRVLERAIRIQSQRHAKETFSADQIRRIARELGLDDSIVDRAIREEVAAPPPATDEGKGWLGPGRLVERSIVAGDSAEVAERIMAWMETEEGLRPVARTTDGIRWEPDKHWMTSTRLAMGSEGTKALRGMPEVVHRQSTLGPGEQLVELEVDTGRIRATAVGVGAGLAGLGVAAGATVAAAVPGGNDLLQFLTGVLPGLAVGATTLVSIARGWTGSIRRGMARALDGIAHPELHRRARRRQLRRRKREESRRSGWQRLVDEVVDAIDDMFD